MGVSSNTGWSTKKRVWPNAGWSTKKSVWPLAEKDGRGWSPSIRGKLFRSARRNALVGVYSAENIALVLGLPPSTSFLRCCRALLHIHVIHCRAKKKTDTKT